MKALLQTIMVGGGLIGLLISIPTAFVAWQFHRGFGGSLSAAETFVIWSPIISLIALIGGAVWIRGEKVDKDEHR